MNPRDLFWLWLWTYLASLSAFVARAMWQLGVVSPDPPDDPIAYRKWRRRRRWLVAAELSALPMFATLSILAVAQGWLSPIAGVIAALVEGALGFAFFTHAIEAVIKKRLGIAREMQP